MGPAELPINDAVIVIDGSRIKAVGSRGQVSYPANARVIRTDGRTILPGLVDAHVHIRDYMPPMFLRYGVTTVADTHDPTEWSLAQRDAINSGRIKGPRTFVSGERAANTREGNPPSIPLQTVDEARAYVKKLIAMGVDVIKVDLSLSYDQLRAVIEEATAAGLSVVGHSQNIRKAAEVGLKYMEHTNTLTVAILEAMGRSARETSDQRGADIALMDTTLFPPLIAVHGQAGCVRESHAGRAVEKFHPSRGGVGGRRGEDRSGPRTRLRARRRSAILDPTGQPRAEPRGIREDGGVCPQVCRGRRQSRERDRRGILAGAQHALRNADGRRYRCAADESHSRGDPLGRGVVWQGEGPWQRRSGEVGGRDCDRWKPVRQNRDDSEHPHGDQGRSGPGHDLRPTLRESDPASR